MSETFHQVLDAQIKVARRKIGEQLVDIQIHDLDADIAAWNLILTSPPTEGLSFVVAKPYGIT